MVLAPAYATKATTSPTMSVRPERPALPTVVECQLIAASAMRASTTTTESAQGAHQVPFIVQWPVSVSMSAVRTVPTQLKLESAFVTLDLVCSMVCAMSALRTTSFQMGTV